MNAEQHDEPHCAGCGKILPRDTDDYQNAQIVTVFYTQTDEPSNKLVCMECQEKGRGPRMPDLEDIEAITESDSVLGTLKAMYRMIDTEMRDVYGISYAKAILSSAVGAAFWGGLGYLMGRRSCK